MKSIHSERNRFIAAFMILSAAISVPFLLLNVIQLDQLTPIIAVFVIFLALVNPQWGIAAMIASLAILEVLPDIPFVSSFSALLGAGTLVSFIFQVFIRRTLPSPPKLDKGLLIGLILIAWILGSHPAASLVLGDRVWLWTIFQLWLVAWLARNLISDMPTTKLVGFSFVFANLLSVYVVFQTGYIGESLYESQRGYGLGLGSNGTARYLLLALLFTYYLYMTNARKKPLQSLTYIGVALTLALGVIYTISRTGLILIILAVGLILISPSIKTNRKKLGFLLLGLVGISFFIPTNITHIAETILPSITGGTDTSGLRYALWTAGWKMFLSSPITGVGIGQFQYLLPKFGIGIVPTRYLDLTSHNMYIQLLVETGIIGLLLFMPMVFIALKNLYQRMHSNDHNQAMTAWMWFSLVTIILVGAITKTEFTEKLLWVGLGIGFTMTRAKKVVTR